MNPNEKAELARELFLSGSNCAQSVYAAFADEMGMSRETALRLSGGLGGGIGGLRFTCGAFLAMAMVMSALRGYTDGADMDGKKRLYAQVQRLHERFVEKYGTSVCRELLEKDGIPVSHVPSERTPEYYKKRRCAQYVAFCAGLAAEELEKK